MAAIFFRRSYCFIPFKHFVTFKNHLHSFRDLKKKFCFGNMKISYSKTLISAMVDFSTARTAHGIVKTVAKVQCIAGQRHHFILWSLPAHDSMLVIPCKPLSLCLST